MWSTHNQTNKDYFNLSASVYVRHIIIASLSHLQGNASPEGQIS